MMINGLLLCRTKLKGKGVTDFIFQIVVPKDNVEQFQHHFHNFLFGCHFGSRKMLKLLLKKYLWKDIAQQLSIGAPV